MPSSPTARRATPHDRCGAATMPPRLTSRLRIDVLRRMAEDAGDTVTILARGDDGAGAILIEAAERGQPGAFWEAGFALDGPAPWIETGPTPDADPAARAAYRARRRQNDGDLWIVELDSPNATRLIAEWAAVT